MEAFISAMSGARFVIGFQTANNIDIVCAMHGSRIAAIVMSWKIFAHCSRHSARCEIRTVHRFDRQPGNSAAAPRLILSFTCGQVESLTRI